MIVKTHFQSALLNTLLMLSGIFIAFGAGEIYLRLTEPPKLFGIESQHNLVNGFFRRLYDYDAQLGWTVKPHVTTHKWNVDIHTVEDGIRSNGQQSVSPGGQTILVFGDSTTFGDESADHETWVAQLENSLRMNPALNTVRVLNAGVSSYGLDQMLLRARQLIPKYRPQIVLLGIVMDDLDRVFQSVRHGISKPYFILKDGQLQLQNVPVPSPPAIRLESFRRWLGRSRVSDLIARRFLPQWVIPYDMETFIPTPEGDFKELNQALLTAFIEQNRRWGAKTVIVNLDVFSMEEQSFHEALKTIEQMQSSDVLFINHGTERQAILDRSEPEFESLYRSGWHSHWTAESHARLAEVLKPIFENLLLESRIPDANKI